MSEKIKQIEVSEENIKKAYEVLGLSFDPEEEEIEKSSKETKKKKAPKPEVEAKSEEEKPKEEEEEEEEEEKEEEEEEKEEEEDVEKAFQTSVDEKLQLLGLLNKDLSQKIEKAIGLIEQVEDFSDRVEKALGRVDDSIQKSLSLQEDSIEKSMRLFEENVGDKIEKSLKLIENIDDRIEDIDDRVEKMEKTPLPRRSITKSFIKKEGEEIEKSVGERVLSLSKDRKAISDILLQKSGFGTENSNDLYVNGIISFESGSGLSKAIMSDLSATENIRFTS